MTRWRRVAVAAGACAAFVLPLALVTAGPAASTSREAVEDRRGDVRQELDDSRASLDHISEELSAALARMAELQAQTSAARAAAEQAAAEADTARARDAEIAVRLDGARAALEATTAELAVRQAEAEDTQRRATSVVREAYRGSDLNDLAILVEASDPQEYADMVLLAETAKRSQDRTMARLQVQQAEIRGTEARQQAQEEELQQVKAEAERVVEQTRQAEEAARQAQASVEALAAEQAETVAAVEAAKVAEEDRLTALTAESDAIERRLAEIAEQERAAAAVAAEEAAAEQRRREAAGEAAPGAPAGGGVLSMPVSGRLTSPFGYRIHPILGYRKLHNGQDFGAPCGTPVHAGADGSVVESGWAGGYGNRVVIAHGTVNGVSLATTYNHLSSFAGASGSVSRGQIVGYVGTTGMSTGCHLHFETREAGTPVDPVKWL
ncbi:MAG: peptidoglycan DD-metalloendopeptidase family protein [Kineosporiaceae bacterium]